MFSNHLVLIRTARGSKLPISQVPPHENTVPCGLLSWCWLQLSWRVFTIIAKHCKSFRTRPIWKMRMTFLLTKNSRTLITLSIVLHGQLFGLTERTKKVSRGWHKGSKFNLLNNSISSEMHTELAYLPIWSGADVGCFCNKETSRAGSLSIVCCCGRLRNIPVALLRVSGANTTLQHQSITKLEFRFQFRSNVALIFFKKNLNVVLNWIYFVCNFFQYIISLPVFPQCLNDYIRFWFDKSFLR